jgi:putative sporulation protein YtaF
VAVVELLAVFMFALAVSTDGFMVGVAYGVRKIKMPVLSMMIIFMASFTAVTISMIFGKGLTYICNPIVASHLGAAILIIIGTYYLVQAGWKKFYSREVDNGVPLVSLNLKSLGVVVQILKEPSSADFDCSGEIGSREALFLGSALAVDAFGAGIGLAMTGHNVLITAASVGLLRFILINIGLTVGKLMENERLQNISPIIAGLILVSLGIYKLL